MDTIGVLTSMALQYGVPLEVLVAKFGHVRFEPSGFTKNPDIPMAKSLIDYVFRFLETRFLGRETNEGGEPAARIEPARPALELVRATSKRSGTDTITFDPQADAPSCPDCGSLMVRNGSCYKCFNCGATSGCSCRLRGTARGGDGGDRARAAGARGCARLCV
jgi:ribonucleoside-diphosphate reductase alpha chain